MVQQLVKHNMIDDALQELRPFVDRVCADKDFREWYDPQLATPGAGSWKASGATNFHGSAVRKTASFFGVFPMFVPSLSWQNDRFNT
jgi:hypothetical protein